MDPVLAWGLDIIRGLQSIANPALTLVVKAITFAGAEYFYLALLTGIYWCVDRRKGMRLVALVLISTSLNLWLKTVFDVPRPFTLDPSVGMAFEPTLSLPSNHAQTSLVFWVAAAILFRGRWRCAAAILPPLLIGLSRVYLGVHYPTDVLAGWAVGGLVIAADRLAGDSIERALAAFRPSIRLAAAAAVVVGMVAAHRQDVSVPGLLFGFAASVIYLPSAAAFSIEGKAPKRALRYLVGIATVALVYVLPKLALAEIELGGPPLIRFLRYAAVGAWASVGAPWLFMKLSLAEPERSAADESADESGDGPGAGDYSA